MPVAIARFERFFRSAAGLDVDKSDLNRYDEFVNDKVSDLLIRAEANAKANGRDVIAPQDLPITKGLQESIHQFRRLGEYGELRPILDGLVRRPVLDLALGEDADQRLPDVAGGLSVALAQSFRILDPDVKNPATEHWDRAFALFSLLL
ncbi:MAG: hypothetical protein JWO79_4837 [Actinomycetia bacterium]|jgi:hypothetical protein|nr:hypothetical protein [Actinomycetes bacterium]MDQ1653743.1 hypothetical protein [Cryptosporangiaceae bacterium]MDQ1660016.1 hypothetical protein [Cryptosporangiaceae bacterium]